MEIKSAIHINKKLVRFCCMGVLLFATAFCLEVSGQPSLKTYTVKNGKMFISLAKQLKESSLDSFISQYDLRDLALKEFIKNGFRDSLVKLGWTIETENNTGIMISKPLFGVENLKNPADRILFAENQTDFADRFPAVSSQVIYGYNRFRNKSPFAIADSIVTFYLRGNINAKTVMLAGSFNNWMSDNLAMIKTDSGWIAELKLAPGKYWYKFLVDGKWATDGDNRLNENDGLGNINSVFYKTNVVFTLEGNTNSKRVYLSGSFNNWDPNELLMNKTVTGWTLPLYVANGTHVYRFVADHHWMADPGNPEKYPNEFGEFNSVLRIGKPYLFYLEGYPNAQQVILTGSFNAWKKDELFMKKTAKGWDLPYTLGAGNYEYHYIIDGKLEVKQANPDSLNGLGNASNFYFVIDPDYTFRLKGFGNAKSVYLAGDFNNWSPNTFAMIKEGEEWILPVHLSKGKHSYKFVVDGKWIIDPGNKLWEQNEFDTGNSVIWIGR